MPLNTTHALLLAYAESTGCLHVAGTIPQLTGWYRFLYGIDIPDRTFKRHTSKLQAAGIISIRHTARRTYYTLLVDEIKVAKYRNVPIGPGVSEWVHDGYEVLKYDPAVHAFGAPADPYRAVDPNGDYGVDLGGSLPEPGICPQCDEPNMTDGFGLCCWCEDNPQSQAVKETVIATQVGHVLAG